MADSTRFPLGRIVPVSTAPIQASVGTTAAQFELSRAIKVSWTCVAEKDPESTLARHLVAAPHRDGDQAQFVEHQIVGRHEVGPIGHTVAWAAANLDQDLSVEALAAHACMSRRSFTRRFRETTGTTPAKWVLARRLDSARALLETTTWSVDRIAAACGFASAVTFRQNFGSAFATTPTFYRRRFAEGSPPVPGLDGALPSS
jgi:transcriptional regulator GlxA family with amidase domain